MESASDTYFVVRFENIEKLLQFAEDATIEDFKLEIYKKFNVKPSRQKIVEWDKFAFLQTRGENLILLSAVREITLLHLINMDNDITPTANNSQPIQNDNTVEEMDTDNNNALSNPILEPTNTLEELHAVVNFIERFQSKYGSDCKIKFNVHVIGDAIEEALQSNKIFMLYLHHDGDIFTKLFCPLLNRHLLYPLFEYFSILSWDISDKLLNQHLKSIVDTVFNMNILKATIDKEVAGVFIFDIASDKTLLFNTFISGNIDEEGFLLTLMQIKEMHDDKNGNLLANTTQTHIEPVEETGDLIQFDANSDMDVLEISDDLHTEVPTQVFESSSRIAEVFEVLSAVNAFDEESINEVSAIDNFLFNLQNIDNCPYLFKRQTLVDAIDDASRSGKIFMLYYHNSSDIFSNLFCPMLLEDGVKDIFNFYHILAWDVTNTKINEFLKTAVSNVFKMDIFINNIDNQKAGVFIFERVNDTLKLNTINSGNFIEDDFVVELYKIQRNVEEKAKERDEIIEKCAVNSFINKFETDYGTNHLDFQLNSIHKAIEIALMVQPKSEQKILAIYFHNEDDIFSKLLCPLLVSSDSKKLLETLFYFLPFDITDTASHEVLKNVVIEEFDLGIMERMIKDKTAALFFFISCNNRVQLFSYISGNVNESTLFLTVSQISESFQESHEITDLAEDQVTNKFIETYGASINGVTCNKAPLQQAIKERVMCPNIATRQILMLYFHNPDKQFSQIFINSLKNHSILKNMLKDHFYFLPWDVTNTSLHSQLALSLRKHFNLEVIESMLQIKEAALFFFVAIDQTLSLFTMMHDKIKEKSLVTIVKDLRETMIKEHNDEMDLVVTANANDFGPKQFQQLMYDQLGDRDYDCFDLLTSGHDKYLKQKIGFAYYGPPSNEEENEEYNEKQRKKVDKAYDKIIQANKEFSQYDEQIILTCIFVCVTPLPKERLAKLARYLKMKIKWKDGDEELVQYNPNTDFAPLPVFILRKCVDCPTSNGCRIFIDHDLRVYKTWQCYMEDNKLHECEMILPKHGKYHGIVNGKVCLEIVLSPACGAGAKILKGVDLGSTIAGVGTGVVVAISLIPAITVAPFIMAGAGIAGISVGIYSVIRSGMAIYDRVSHDESMHIAEAEARGAYLNIIAGSLGFAGAGATTALTYFVSNGANIGNITRVFVNGITGANIIASGVGLTNSAVEVIYQWIAEDQRPTMLTFVQLSSSILFFGHAVYNVRSANMIINEVQASTLQELQGSMRSNRHRKTFDKLKKETIRTQGDTQSGQAEVISYIKNLNNRDEVLATLTRANKYLNQEGVKFSVENNNLNFNGIPVDVQEFGSFSAQQRTQFLSDLPPMVESTRVQTQNVRNYLTDTLSTVRYGSVISEVFDVIIRSSQLSTFMTNLINVFSNYVQRKLIEFFAELVKEFTGDLSMNSTLSDIYPGSYKFLEIFKVILKYFKTLANNAENEYNNQIISSRADPNFDVTDFNNSFFGGPFVNQALWFFEKAVVVATLTPSVIIRELMAYLKTWLIQKVYEMTTNIERQERLEQQSIKPKIKCDICEGNYYK